ncbi:MAG: hypothetical protein WBG86_13715 [Polyangiales bacterium]
MIAAGRLLFCVVLIAGCGDSSEFQACDDLCGLPDQCFAELGVPDPGSDCISTCEEQIGMVGVGCVNAINVTIACLGTCDFDSLTEADILDCQDEASDIGPACE